MTTAQLRKFIPSAEPKVPTAPFPRPTAALPAQQSGLASVVESRVESRVESNVGAPPAASLVAGACLPKGAPTLERLTEADGPKSADGSGGDPPVTAAAASAAAAGRMARIEEADGAAPRWPSAAEGNPSAAEGNLSAAKDALAARQEAPPVAARQARRAKARAKRGRQEAAAAHEAAQASTRADSASFWNGDGVGDTVESFDVSPICVETIAGRQR
jgi:hypothetical protein